MKKNIVSISRWFFGVFFALGSTVELSEDAVISAISALLLSILLIPPFSAYVFSKIRRPVPTLAKVIVGIVLFFVMIGTASSSTSSQSQPSQNSSTASVSSDEQAITETITDQTATIEPSPTPLPIITTFEVVSVVDGDTFKVVIDGKNETVRLVGINTPETVDPRRPVECFGKEASDKLKSLLLGQHVALEPDETQSDRDTYGRLLRFAKLHGVDDVGLMMLQEGYAEESLYSSTPHVLYDSYVQAEKEAQESKKGLWADNVCPVSTPKPTATPKPTQAPVKLNTPTPSPKPVSTSTPPPSKQSSGSGGSGYSCTGPDLDCKDFSSRSEVLQFWNTCGFSASYDPHRLDGNDNDGQPCESL